MRDLYEELRRMDLSEIERKILKQQYQIDDLKNDIAFLREQAAQPKWQPIETAPLDSGMPHYFLVYTSHENTLMACGMEGELTYLTFIDGLSFDTDCYGTPTHWMPLPEPPEVTP